MYSCLLLRASSYAQRLKLRLAVIYGNKKDEELDGRTSPPPEATGVSPMRSRTTLSMSTSSKGISAIHRRSIS